MFLYTDAVQAILLGGDQLSSAMARRVIADRKNSMNAAERFDGIIPVTEDWHSKLCYLTVSSTQCTTMAFF